MTGLSIKLRHIVVLGALLRIAFALTSDHLFYPDELHQSLEQAHRIVYGYGIIPWDYVHELRSWILPLILSVFLYLGKFLGLTTPQTYIPYMKIILSLSTLVLIPGIHRVVTLVSGSKKAALLAAFFIATWYELLYFSPRAFSETIALSLITTAFLIHTDKGAKAANYVRLVGIGFILGLALVIRPHYATISLPLLWYIAQKKLPPRKIVALFGGWGSAILMSGMLDVFVYGTFFIHLYNLFYYNIVLKVTDVFFTQPFTWYVKSLLITSAGLWIFLLPTIQKRLYRPLWLLVLSVVGAHSLIAHKEYRYVYAAIPILLAMSAIQIRSLSSKQSQKVSIILTIGISLLGLFHQLPWQKEVYFYPPLYQDPSLQLYKSLSNVPDVCGIYDTTRPWFYTGGYYYLHKQIPLFDPRDTPAVDQYNYTITTTEPLQTIHLEKSHQNCKPENSVSYNKTVAEVEVVLKAHGLDVQ